MSHALSLQPGSSAKTLHDANKIGKFNGPCQERLTALPLALIKHAMNFLSLEDMMRCQRTNKVFKTDIWAWSRNRQVLDVYLLFRYHTQKKGLEREAALDQLRLMGGCFREIIDVQCDLANLTKLFSVSPEKSPWPAFPHVETLTVSFPPLGHRDNFNPLMQNIGWNLPTLTNLRVKYYETSETVEALLKACPKLVALEIVDGPLPWSKYGPVIPFNPACAIALCPQLKDLSLGRFSPWHNFKEYANVTQLCSLRIDDPREEQLECLMSHPNLRSVSLRRADLALQSIYPGASRDSKKSIEALAKIPHLQHLGFDQRGGHLGFDENGPSNLPPLLYPPSGPTQLTPLNNAKNLKSITFSNLNNFQRGLLLQTLPRQIEDLHFEMCHQLDDEDLESISKCTKLRHLKLEDNTLVQNWHLSDKGLASLASCQGLVSLSISSSYRQTCNVTTAGVVALAKALPFLRQLDLSKCWLAGVDANAVESALSETNPKLLVQKRET